jgi:hypothetical protein
LNARDWYNLSLRLKNMVEGEYLDIFDYEVMVKLDENESGAL